MSSYEMQFVKIVEEKRTGLQIYRTPHGVRMGDFVVVDQSDHGNPIGTIVELKSAPDASHAGIQLKNGNEAARLLGLVEYRTFTGTVSEFLDAIGGRSDWPWGLDHQ